MSNKKDFQDWFEELKEHITKATEKRVIDEVFTYIKILEKKHTYKSEPDYELCGFQQPESYVAYSRVFEELKKKYGVEV